MDIFDICGYSAGIFYVGSFIPQIYKSKPVVKGPILSSAIVENLILITNK